jgi:pilus assembly protein CpaE
MDTEHITVGILSPSPETREQLRIVLGSTKLRSSVVEVEQYCIGSEDPSFQRIVEANPQVIIIDMHAAEAGLLTLQVLHDALPGTWLFVVSESNDAPLIIKTMQAGAREFLLMPLTAAALTEALARYYGERAKIGRIKETGKIYCVTSAKGGAGTTSVAVNLAVAIASARGTKSALLDLGTPVGDVAEYLNLKPRFSIADALNSAAHLDPVLLESYISRSSGVSVMPGYREFHPDPFVPETLGRIFRVFNESYTHTFVDLACSQDYGQMQIAAEYSTSILVVLTPELPALWRTDRLIRLFEKTGGIDRLLLIVNRSSKNREISIREIEKTLGRRVFWSLPNNYPAAIHAVNSGKPLVSFNHSSLASSYFELGQALTGVPLKQKRRTLFGS